MPEAALPPKPLRWVGDSRKRISNFRNPQRTPLATRYGSRKRAASIVRQNLSRGFKSAGVLEVVEDFDGDTFRAVYTVRFKSAVYVLHCFQKKSKKGAATPKADMNMVIERLRAAERDERERRTT